MAYAQIHDLAPLSLAVRTLPVIITGQEETVESAVVKLAHRTTTTWFPYFWQVLLWYAQSRSFFELNGLRT